MELGIRLSFGKTLEFRGGGLNATGGEERCIQDFGGETL
jgi:hypothetical protein